MPTGELVSYIVAVCAVIGCAVGVWGARRAKRSSDITDAVGKLDLWERENRGLEARVKLLEDTNRTQAAQIADLRADNARLQELVTSAAAVRELTATVEKDHAESAAAMTMLTATIDRHHTEVMTELAGRKPSHA